MAHNRYVYRLIVDGVVRYVGKGTEQRLNWHVKHARRIMLRRANGEKIRTSPLYNHLAKALMRGATIESEIVVDGLNDEEAWELEKSEIASAPVGQLWNFTPGGEGRTSEDLKRQWESDPDLRARHAAAMAVVLADPEVLRKISEGTKASWTDPEIRKLREDAILASLGTPENKARAAEHAKSIWSDPEIRSRIVESLKRSLNDPEYLAFASKHAKDNWADPDIRARNIASIKEWLASPEGQAQRSLATKKLWSDPEHRAFRVANMKATADPDRLTALGKANWSTPKKRARMIASRQNRTPEQRAEETAKRVAANKALWVDPEWRARMLEARKK